MNNYRTNCNNRRVMPSASPCMQTMQNYQAQRMENMQENCRNRTSNGTQNCQTSDCGCNDVQNGQNCNCSCKETQNNCKDEQSCTCSCNHCENNNVQSGQDNNCDCNMPESSACRPEPTLLEFPIGMAYVPIQQWRRLYDICAAFRNGTLFQELNLDFLGRRCN